MWCSGCQQDVPGIASRDELNVIVCARCGSDVSSRRASQTDSGWFEESARLGAGDDLCWERLPQPDELAPVIDLDDWQLEEDLQTAEQMVRSLHPPRPTPVSEPASSAANQQALHQLAQWHTHSRHTMAELPQGMHRSPKRSQPRQRGLSWTFLTLGIATVVCGAVLSGLSFVGWHDQLWNLGLPLVMAGQGGLLLGLIFQLDGLWQTNRQTTETLDELESRLSDLKHTTAMMSSSPSGPAQSFYAHMAQGASPQLMLADLKGQLDLLAIRMSQER